MLKFETAYLPLSSITNLELRSFQLDLFLMRWLIKKFYLAACVASKYPVKLYVVVALFWNDDGAGGE